MPGIQECIAKGTTNRMDMSLSRMRQLVVLLVFSSLFIHINMKGSNKNIELEKILHV